MSRGLLSVGECVWRCWSRDRIINFHNNNKHTLLSSPLEVGQIQSSIQCLLEASHLIIWTPPALSILSTSMSGLYTDANSKYQRCGNIRSSVLAEQLKDRPSHQSKQPNSYNKQWYWHATVVCICVHVTHTHTHTCITHTVSRHSNCDYCRHQ